MHLSTSAFVLLLIYYSIVVVQLFYYGYFFARLTTYKAPSHSISSTHAVSIIICARDEAHNLQQNLPTILAQNYPTTHELIIVNDNSYDDTADVLASFQKTHKHINTIHLTEQAKFVSGKKFPLSVGIKASKHELLLLTDADCTPAGNNWVQSMQSHFTPNIHLVLGYGPYHKLPGWLNKVIRYETYLTALQYLSYCLAGQSYMGVGRNIAYKKTLFNQANGFSSHNHLASGDDDLFVNQVSNKYNTTININPESFVYSTPKTSWQGWVNQKYRHLSTSNYYKPKHKLLLGLYSASQMLVYPIFVACLVVLPWYFAITAMGVRLICLLIINSLALNQLHERDLKPWLLVLDVWHSLYLLIFAPALLKKPKQGWS